MTFSHVDVRSPGQWARLLLELATIFAIFHWSAALLGSDRGQAGLIVGAIVVTALLTVERLRSAATLASAARAIGFGLPRPIGLAAAVGVCALLALMVPAFARSSGTSVTLHAGWLWLLPGLFAQAGIAEEALFRGFLYGHVRRGRSFWRATCLSMWPFVAVHLLLFALMPWPVALAALLLSVALSFPLAHLFELGGRTIWPPAILHFVVQSTVKVVTFSGDGSSFPLVWMTASTVLPMLVLLIPRQPSNDPVS